ncbi:MAG: hypothetical protein LH478_16245 [Chitinophagaceae bacterium]|nr:hypothetical protein [Chitinophagaceae bacterium]
MKYLLFFLVSFVAKQNCTAQVDPVGSFNRHVFEAWQGESIRIGPFSVKGSPYLFGEAFDGFITYKGGRVLNQTRILYDVYHQKAGVELQSMIYEAVKPVESFTIKLPEKFGGQRLLFKASALFGEDVKGFYVVIEEGEKSSFLKMYKSKIIADPNNPMDTKMKVFEQYVEYYLFKKDDRSMHPVKLKKKDFLKEFGDIKFADRYLANNTVDFGKEQDVADLLHAYNLGL